MPRLKFKADPTWVTLKLEELNKFHFQSETSFVYTLNY